MQSRQNSVLRRKPITPGGSGDDGRVVGDGRKV